MTGAVACSGDEETAAEEPTAPPPVDSTETGPDPDPGTGTRTGEAATGIRRYLGQQVEWADCGDGFECATIEVPVDYDDPDGAAIELALNRLPASDPDARVGSLLLNPGGPPGWTGCASPRRSSSR
jgi:hypothetical protein